MSVNNADANIRGFSIHTGIKVKMQEAQNQRMKAYKSFKLGSFPLVLTYCISSIMPPRTRSKQNKASRFRKHVRLVEPSQPNVGESEPDFDLDEFIVDVEKENTTTGNPRSEGERIKP